jgi:hypothetical protein|tara:strand:- start:44 stop:190 length:147 start_codon:yes stop_codon:yes gene_type:complete
MFAKNEDSLYVIMLGCAIILLFKGAVIIGLHMEERNQDKEKNPDLPLF